MLDAFLDFFAKSTLVLGLGGLVLLFFLNLEHFFTPRETARSLKAQLMELVRPRE